MEEAEIAVYVGTGGSLRRGPEEPQRGDGAGRRIGAGDPAVLDADRIGGQREADGGDARERRRGRAVGGEATRRGREIPEVAEGAVLQGIEKCRRVGRDARAPGVTGTASEGQGKDDGCESDTVGAQNVYSAPICKRRGSLTTHVGVVPPFIQPKF